MIYRLFIFLILIAAVIYYFFCFLEIFDVLKFTDEGDEVKFPQFLIPFYYIIKKPKKKKENKTVNDFTEEMIYKAFKKKFENENNEENINEENN